MYGGRYKQVRKKPEQNQNKRECDIQILTASAPTSLETRTDLGTILFQYQEHKLL